MMTGKCDNKGTLYFDVFMLHTPGNMARTRHAAPVNPLSAQPLILALPAMPISKGKGTCTVKYGNELSQPAAAARISPDTGNVFTEYTTPNDT